MEGVENVVIPETKWALEEIEYSGVKISVYPYVSVESEISLILNYVAQYLSPNIDDSNPKWNDVIVGLTNRNIWFADYMLMQEILTRNTNVNIEKLSPEDTMSLFKKVISDNNIRNYWDFKERLMDTVIDVKREIESRRSVGAVIDSTVNKIVTVLESIQSLDVEKLKELGTNLVKTMEESSVASVFTESNKEQIENKSKTKNKEKVTKE